MARCTRVLLMLLSLASPGYSWAAGNYSVNLSPTDTGINAASLNASPAMTIRTDGYSSLTVYVAYTHASATTVVMSCTSGPTLAVQAPLGVANVNGSTGAISMAQAAWTYGVTTNATLRIIIQPINDVYAVCTFTGAGAASGDLISVYGKLGGIP